MSSKKKKQSKSKSTSLKSRFSLFRDDRFRYASGIVFILFAFYLFLSFISYFFHWQTDQDFRWAEVFSGPEITVENQGGKWGAWLSDTFINRWFGIPSLLFPVLLIVWALGLFRLRILKTWAVTRNLLILLILSSVTLSVIFGSASGYLGSGPGGSHGYHISRWMIAAMGYAGAGVVLLILFSFFLLFTTPVLHRIRERREQMKGRNQDESLVDDESETGEHAEDQAPAETIFEHDAEEDDTISGMNGSPGESFVVSQRTRHEQGQPQTVQSPDSEDVEMSVNKTGGEEQISGQDGSGELQDYDPTLELPHYKLPPLSLLRDYDSGDTTVTNEELLSNKNRIVETLASYKIKIDKIKATIGPTVTLYEIVPAPGIRISKIKNLEDDIALSLAALGIRIIAPIPGKGTIGIEVPNQTPKIVSMRTILSSRKFQESDFELAIALGKTISNETFTFDLTRMPHLLVAGATGQGKSVGLNAIIASLLYKKHPAQLKFVMIDPKKVELSLFSKIENHFLAKLEDTEDAIITDTQKVISTLNSLCVEMDERYDLLQKAHVRNIKEYNKKFIARKLNPEKGHRYLPFIVVVIDEFADLIMTAGRNIETPISRLAQLARAIGIHLVIATQRPTTNIITGVIKANFPARIAFRVMSGIDSRTILDGPGADQLIGRGDMLFLSGNEPVRLQCAFIDTPEIDDITAFISEQKGYAGAMELSRVDEETGDGPDVDLRKRDDLFEDAARLVVQHQQGSTSLIQRKLALGYNRAGRIVDQLEAAGILGPSEGSKARQVLAKDEMSLEQILNELR
jgi:S-DNA-T family DNA segregation ATPase FtsK/SpoIIIE